MPSDIDRVRVWFASGALLAPDPSLPNSVDLALALASVAGVPDVALTENASAIAARAAGAEHLVFVLADGLGMNLIETLPEGSFLRQQTAMELRAVFPPTTAAALTTLATGLWPAQHAVPSWFSYLREYDISAVVLPFVQRFTERPLQHLGVEPARVFTKPPLMARSALDTCSYLPAAIAGSTYTRYVTGDTPTAGYERFGEALDAAARRIEAASEPTYTYLYYPTIDSAQHENGPDADIVHGLLTFLDLHLGEFASRLEGRVRVVLSADHGLLFVPHESQFLLPPGDALLDLLVAPPSGEPRVPFFHVRSTHFSSFAEQFRARFGGMFALLTVDEAEELRLFGPEPLSPLARDRIGSAIALAGEPAVLLHRLDSEFLGFHAGLSPDEVRVPLVIA